MRSLLTDALVGLGYGVRAVASAEETLDILTAATDAGIWDPRIVVRLPDVLREVGASDEPGARMPGGMGHGA